MEGVPGVENAGFVEKSTSKYHDSVKVEARDNERVKRMLMNLRERYKVIKVGDDEIRIRVAVPLATRDLAATMVGMSPEEYDELGGIVGVTDKLYEIAADMCLDPPFNDPATWYLMDSEADGVLYLIRQILDAANDTDAQVHNFR